MVPRNSTWVVHTCFRVFLVRVRRARIFDSQHCDRQQYARVGVPDPVLVAASAASYCCCGAAEYYCCTALYEYGIQQREAQQWSVARRGGTYLMGATYVLGSTAGIRRLGIRDILVQPNRIPGT